MYRIIAGLSLLFCLIGPIMTVSFWLHYKQNQVRKEVWSNIQEESFGEEIVALGFSIAESKHLLKWEHEREFEYNGQMYDIISVLQTQDSIFYNCYWDKKETFIKDQKRKVAEFLFHFPEPQDQKHQSQIQQFYKSLYCTQLPAWVNHSFPLHIKEIPYLKVLESLTLIKASPPPESYNPA